MYKIESQKQLSFENFYLPFGGSLNPRNRWIQLSKLIPWEEFEETYAKQFSEEGMGAPAKSFRMALGALLIKEKLRITDEETVQQIRENHYLQYLIGMEGYQDEELFDPSMMVYFRRRITMEMLCEINERVHEEQVKKNNKIIRRLKKKKKLL